MLSKGSCDQKHGLTGSATEGVDEETTDETANETDDSGKRDGSCLLAERDTAYEDNGLHACHIYMLEIHIADKVKTKKRTFTQDGDQRKNEEHPFSRLSTRIDVYGGWEKSK